MGNSVGVGVVVCGVFDADGVVVDAVYVCEECEVWVVWELHDVVGIAEGMEPVVALVLDGMQSFWNSVEAVDVVARDFPMCGIRLLLLNIHQAIQPITVLFGS